MLESAPFLSPLPGARWPGLDGLVSHPAVASSSAAWHGPAKAASHPADAVKTSSRLLSNPVSHKGLNSLAVWQRNPDRESGNCDPKRGTFQMGAGPKDRNGRGAERSNSAVAACVRRGQVALLWSVNQQTLRTHPSETAR